MEEKESGKTKKREENLMERKGKRECDPKIREMTVIEVEQIANGGKTEISQRREDRNI